MRGRRGNSEPRTNVDQAEPLGAFVGDEAEVPRSGTPPRWSKGKTRVSSKGFMAEGESQATSVKAARVPTHWRRGGYVQRKQDGGSVGLRSERVEYEKARRRLQKPPVGADSPYWSDEREDEAAGRDLIERRKADRAERLSGGYATGGPVPGDLKTKPPSDVDFDEEKPTNYKRGGRKK